MKYYIISEKISDNISIFKCVVEHKTVAKAVCERYPSLTYEECDDGSHISLTSDEIVPIINSR